MCEGDGAVEWMGWLAEFKFLLLVWWATLGGWLTFFVTEEGRMATRGPIDVCVLKREIRKVLLIQVVSPSTRPLSWFLNTLHLLVCCLWIEAQHRPWMQDYCSWEGWFFWVWHPHVLKTFLMGHLFSWKCGVCAASFGRAFSALQLVFSGHCSMIFAHLPYPQLFVWELGCCHWSFLWSKVTFSRCSQTRILQVSFHWQCWRLDTTPYPLGLSKRDSYFKSEELTGPQTVPFVMKKPKDS